MNKTRIAGRPWRRASAALVLALTSALVVTACGGTDSGDKDGSDGQVTLTFWTRGTGSEELAERFHSQQSDIRVEITRVGGAEYVTKLATASRSGDAPDILDLDIIQAPLFSAENLLADITDKVNALDFVDSINTAQMDISKYQGVTYAVPNIAGPSVLMYNKDIFRKIGMDPEKAPSTWAEIEEAAQKATALGDGTYGYSIPVACGACLAYITYPLIWASGGDVIVGEPGPDQHTVYSEDPAVEATFEFLSGLWEKGYINPAEESETGATWGESFSAGKLAILVGTPEGYASAVAAGVDVGVAPIPGKDGDFSTFVGGDLLAITAQSEHVEEAWTFIEWMLQPEQQEYLAEVGLAPVRLDMLDDEFLAKYPASAAALKAMERGQVPNTVAWQAIAGDNSSPFYKAFQESVVYDGDIPALLAKADEDSNALIKEAAQDLGLG
ncbi:MAG: sugar ABC transporter substrate-binding protein [Bifidobacteriaceae bacterium]|jgi:multiple sugar transport system substrate-binding protein|nr:sugar ABC transporter substrate-binding protein [Bifidobacteriaceae bacterium]